MSLVDLAQEYAFEQDTAVYVHDVDEPVVDAQLFVREILDDYESKGEVNHGACCGLPFLHVVVGFERKVDYHGAPSDMRERTLIATTVFTYMQWMENGAGGLLAKPLNVLDPAEVWADYLETYVGATVFPKSKYVLAQIGPASFNKNKERFALPYGPMVTPSKAYCATETVRTLPIESVYRMTTMIRIGKLPTSLAYPSISESIPSSHISTLALQKGSEDQIKYIASPPPNEAFNVGAVVETLRGMVL